MDDHGAGFVIGRGAGGGEPGQGGGPEEGQDARRGRARGPLLSGAGGRDTGVVREQTAYRAGAAAPGRAARS